MPVVSSSCVSSCHSVRRGLLTALAATLVAACGVDDGGAPVTFQGQPASASPLAQACDFSGTWAVRFTIPVKWSYNPGIQAGTGNIIQVAKTIRQHDGDTLTDALHVCDATVPDYRTQRGLGNELYGIRFPASLFDRGALPAIEVRTQLSASTVGASYATDRAAIQLGVALQDPVNDAWPRKLSELRGITDDDADDKPGITLVADESPGYTMPRTSLVGGANKRANQFYTAVRNVAVSQGTVASCDKMAGEASIADIDGKPAVNSHVLGCHKLDGTECSSRDTILLDGSQPAYVPAVGEAVMVRVPEGTSCADIRAMQF